MHVRQSHEMIGRRWCWARFAERSGVDRNRTVVDVVIPPRQSNEARQRDTKALCGCDSRKPVRPVRTVFFPEPVTNASPGAAEWRGRTWRRRFTFSSGGLSFIFITPCHYHSFYLDSWCTKVQGQWSRCNCRETDTQPVANIRAVHGGWRNT